MNLTEVLTHLDPAADDNWTADGLPRMDAVIELTGDGALTRKQVTDAVPGLTRDTAYAMAEQADVPEPVLSPPVGHEDVVPDPDAPIAVVHEDESQPAEQEQLDATEEAAASIPPAAEEEGDEHGGVVDVLSLPIGEVLGNPDLTELAILVISDRAAERLQAKKAIEEELRQLYAKSEMLTRAKTQQDRRLRATGEKRTNVQDYLASQAKAREGRAARARKFIEAGTSVKDVAAQLRNKSPLDAALAQRRPAPGTGRPAIRTPQH